jgi:hypothetical protein
MILIYMLACRSVGGSEGFIIHDAMLLHVEDSESVEVSGAYEKEHSGMTVLLAWGGGKCPNYAIEDQPPEGEGWKKSQGTPSTDKERDEARCESLGDLVFSYGGTLASELYRNSLSVYIYDIAGNPEKTMSAVTTECTADSPQGYDTVQLELDSADLKIHGDLGHITAKAGSELVVDLTLPVCFVE